MRLPPSEFRKVDLGVHAFLADVPLHDAWRIRLSGGGPGRTVSDVLDLFDRVNRAQLNPAVRALFALRASLGRLFGWDDPGHAAISRSYVGRLSEADRSRSLEEPGVQRGVWRVVYTFEDEALREVINRTVHAFVLFALRPATDGYTLYWGIYVKPVGKLTAVYMALIDPFRRWLVYPEMIRQMENAWPRMWPSGATLREAASSEEAQPEVR